MKNRAGAYTGARFAHVASHKKKQKHDAILCEKALPEDHTTHGKKCGKGKKCSTGSQEPDKRPKSQVPPPWRSTCGRSEGASRSHSRTKRAPRNTHDIKNDANLCDKKGINMTAKVMHEKKPGETPSKHEKSCWRLHRSTICTCCIAQEKTEKEYYFVPKGSARRPQKPQKKRGNGKKYSAGS